LLGSTEEEGLSLGFAADVHPRPWLFGNLDPDLADLPVSLQHATAERETEHFDLGAGMLACRRVDECLEGLAGYEAVGSPLAERGREVAFEPDRDRQIAGVVAIAAADDTQHPQAGFALATRTKSRHRGNSSTGSSA
jgi:hypothetical protein